MSNFQTRPEIERSLIAAGVRNLKTFGYLQVTCDNITSDSVFSAFFRSMLEDNKGHSGDFDQAIDRLIAEIDAGKETGT